jgi:sialidase-1
MIRSFCRLCVVTGLITSAPYILMADDTTTMSLVTNGKVNAELIDASAWQQKADWIEGTGANNYLLATVALGPGNFRVDAKLRMLDQHGSAAHFLLGDGCFGFEGRNGEVFLSRSLFGGLRLLMPSKEVFPPGTWIDFTAERHDGKIRFLINQCEVHAFECDQEFFPIGFCGLRATMQISNFPVRGKLHKNEIPEPPEDIVDVYRSDTGGYHGFRIPSALVTDTGTVLAFAEGRPTSLADAGGNDLVLRRSTDGGRTWSKMKVIAEDGPHSLNTPCAVQVHETGRIILFYHRYPAGTNETSVESGVEGSQICRALMITSDDDGITWSEPRDITKQAKRPTLVTSFSTGPGIGIQLRRGSHKGRIVMLTNQQGPRHQWNVFAIYSDDGGDSWAYGELAPNTTKGWGNEVQAVELTDGTVMLNARVQDGNKCRKTATSTDGGMTWSSLREDNTLIEPTCQGSIFRLSDPLDGRQSRILFSNPASQMGRKNGTVRLSYDEGKTWAVSRVICPGSFAYSSLTVLPDGTIGCLFESDQYQKIRFARFTLDWLTGGQDAWETETESP